jgi:hypothetical protein
LIIDLTQMMKMMTASITANRSTVVESVGEADCKKIVNMNFPPESIRDTDYSLPFRTVPPTILDISACVGRGFVAFLWFPTALAIDSKANNPLEVDSVLCDIVDGREAISAWRRGTTNQNNPRTELQ